MSVFQTLSGGKNWLGSAAAAVEDEIVQAVSLNVRSTIRLKKCLRAMAPPMLTRTRPVRLLLARQRPWNTDCVCQRRNSSLLGRKKTARLTLVWAVSSDQRVGSFDLAGERVREL